MSICLIIVSMSAASPGGARCPAVVDQEIKKQARAIEEKDDQREEDVNADDIVVACEYSSR